MRRKVKQLVVGEIYVDVFMPYADEVVMQYVESNDRSDYFKAISGEGYLKNSKGLIGFRKGMDWYEFDGEIVNKNKDGVIQVDNNITRVEVIDEKGRVYTNWKPTNKVELQIQDGGKTLKIFVGQEL